MLSLKSRDKSCAPGEARRLHRRPRRKAWKVRSVGPADSCNNPEQ